MTPSNPSCATRTRELSKRVRRSSAASAVSSSQRMKESDCQTWSHRLMDGTRMMNHGNVQNRFWRVLMSGGAADNNGTAKRVTNAHLTGLRRRSWYGQYVLASCDGIGRARSLADRVLGFRELKSMHEASACHRAAGTPRRIAFLDRRNCSLRMYGQGGGKVTKGRTVTGLGWQEVIRLRMAEAQPTHPDDKKHLLFKSGEVKWCWKCGARVERDSAPRLLLKTACSGTLRTKEYERAVKGSIRRALCSKGIRHPPLMKNGTTDIRTTATCFSVCASCLVVSTPRARTAFRVKEDDKNKNQHQHTNTPTHQHTNTPTHQHTNTQTHKHTNTQTHTHKQTNTHTHTHRSHFGSSAWLCKSWLCKSWL